LLHKTNGLRHRHIAVAIDRPVSTVLRWLRRPTSAYLERIYRGGTRQLLALDPDVHRAGQHRNLLHHALSILSAAAYCERHRYGIDDPPWTLIGPYTAVASLPPPA
jgi:hypothetical protein